MTYVSTGESSGTLSATTVVGDLVVAVASRIGGAPSTPGGWQRLGVWWAGEVQAGIYWRRATSTTTSASFGTWVQWVVLRGPTAVDQVIPAVMNSQDFRWSPITYSSPMTGHLLSVGLAYPVVYGPTLAPAASTQRQAETRTWPYTNPWGYPAQDSAEVAISERAVTAVTSVAAGVATGYRSGGWSILVSAVVVAGPDAPTITSPTAPTADLAAGFAVAWTPSGEQSGYTIRRRVGAGAWAWWTGTDWSASAQTVITSTAQSVTIPAAQFVAGTTYDLAVATAGGVSRPDVGTYAQISVTSRGNPTATTLTPSTGPITTLTPALSVAGTAGAGGTLDLCQVQVVDAVTGEVYRDVTHAPGWWHDVPVADPLPNDTTIKLKGRVRQNGAQWSPWITGPTLLIAAPKPSAPAVTATAWEHPVSGLPGAWITVITDASGTATIYRDEVQVWTAPVVAGTPAYFEDYAAADGTVYSATVTTGDGVTTVLLTSALGPATALVMDPRAWHCWLSDPLDPSTALRTHLVDADAETHSLETTTYRPLGSTVAVVHARPVQAADGKFTLFMDGPDRVDALVALLGSGRRLMLQRHLETSLDGATYLRRTTFRPVGELSVVRPVNGPHAARTVSFGWVSQ